MRADQLSVLNVKCHLHCNTFINTIFQGTLLINGRSLDANYCKCNKPKLNYKNLLPKLIPMILLSKFIFEFYCLGSPSPPTGCLHFKDF